MCTELITPNVWFGTVYNKHRSVVKLYEELGEPSRRAILVELFQGPKTVTELCNATGLKQPNVSNHLARMRERAIVTRTKRGREAFYSLSTVEVRDAIAGVIRHFEPVDSSVDLPTLAEEYADRAIAGDELACVRIIDRCLRVGMSLLTIYQEVLCSAMDIVAKRFPEEDCGVAGEHMATAISERMLARVFSARQSAPPLPRKATLGSAPGDWHTLGLRMISDYLRSMGWQTFYLGGSVPQDSFIAQVRKEQPELVLVEIGWTDALGNTIHLLEELNQARGSDHSFIVGVGGYAAQRHEHELTQAGADFVCSSLAEFAGRLPTLNQSAVDSRHYMK